MVWVLVVILVLAVAFTAGIYFFILKGRTPLVTGNRRPDDAASNSPEKSSRPKAPSRSRTK